jgi:hypothetical protein
MLINIDDLDLWSFENLDFLIPFVQEVVRSEPDDDE